MDFEDIQSGLSQVLQAVGTVVNASTPEGRLRMDKQAESQAAYKEKLDLLQKESDLQFRNQSKLTSLAYEQQKKQIQENMGRQIIQSTQAGNVLDTQATQETDPLRKTNMSNMAKLLKSGMPIEEAVKVIGGLQKDSQFRTADVQEKKLQIEQQKEANRNSFIDEVGKHMESGDISDPKVRKTLSLKSGKFFEKDSAEQKHFDTLMSSYDVKIDEKAPNWVQQGVMKAQQEYQNLMRDLVANSKLPADQRQDPDQMRTMAYTQMNNYHELVDPWYQENKLKNPLDKYEMTETKNSPSLFNQLGFGNPGVTRTWNKAGKSSAPSAAQAEQAVKIPTDPKELRVGQIKRQGELKKLNPKATDHQIAVQMMSEGWYK